MRFLLAKALYDKEDGLHLDEYLVLFDLYYGLREKSDPTFVAKYKEWFERTEPFFRDFASCNCFPARPVLTEHSLKLYQEFLNPVLPSQQAYYGLKGNRQLRTSFEVRLRLTLEQPSIKPKRFIGVGYKDKGSRKDVAFDGSPSWQEVASHFTELERREDEGEFEDSPNDVSQQSDPLLE
jgi:hypothetical protein